MENEKIYQILLSSTVFGTMLGAGITAGFSYFNSRAQRKLDKQKLYFEKAYSAYQDFEKDITNRQVLSDSFQELADQNLEKIISGEMDRSWPDMVGQIETFSKTIGPIRLKNNQLNLFIDLNKCVPQDLYKLVKEFNSLHEELRLSVRKTEYLHDPNLIEGQTLLERISDTSKKLSKSYTSFRNNINDSFRKTYNI